MPLMRPLSERLRDPLVLTHGPTVELLEAAAAELDRCEARLTALEQAQLTTRPVPDVLSFVISDKENRPLIRVTGHEVRVEDLSEGPLFITAEGTMPSPLRSPSREGENKMSIGWQQPRDAEIAQAAKIVELVRKLHDKATSLLRLSSDITKEFAATPFGIALQELMDAPLPPPPAEKDQ